jgi:hypothetical protein
MGLDSCPDQLRPTCRPQTAVESTAARNSPVETFDAEQGSRNRRAGARLEVQLRCSSPYRRVKTGDD